MTNTREETGRRLTFTPDGGSPIDLSGVAGVSIDAGRELPDPDATRYPDVAGFPAILADGRVWHLALPTARLRPRFRANLPHPRAIGGNDPGSSAELSYRVGYPLRAQRAAEDLERTIRELGPEADPPFLAIVTTAAELLMLCHALDLDAAAELLSLSAEEAIDLAVLMLRAFRGVRAGGEEPHTEPIENPSNVITGD